MAEDDSPKPSPNSSRRRFNRLLTPLKHTSRSRTTSVTSLSPAAQQRLSAGSRNSGSEDFSIEVAQTSSNLPSPALETSPEITEPSNDQPSMRGSDSRKLSAPSQSQESGVTEEDVTVALERELTKQQSGKMIQREEWAKVTLICVLLKEATIDSPTFRASMEYTNQTLEEMQTWMNKFQSLSAQLAKQLKEVLIRVNEIIGQFLPDFATKGLFLEDYTSLVLGRYAEGMHLVWSSLLGDARSHNERIQTVFTAFRNGAVAHYALMRKAFVQTQHDYDTACTAYFALDKHASHNKERDALQKLWKARRSYMDASHALSCAVARIEAEATVTLVDTLSFPFQLRKHSVLTLSEERVSIGVDMHRLHALAHEMKSNLPRLDAYLVKLRKEIAEKYRYTFQDDFSPRSPATPSTPSSDFSASSTDTFQRQAMDSGGKFGWVGVDISGKWVRLWAFAHSGVFGLLGLSPDRTYVQESDKFDLSLCEAHPDKNHSRRFVFRVTISSGQELVCQARSESDLTSWISAFHSVDRPATPIENRMLTPWSGDFSLFHGLNLKKTDNDRGNGNGVTFNSSATRDRIMRRYKEVSGTVLETKGILNSSTLSMSNIELSVPALLATKPMPTARSAQSAIANWYLMPHDVPNAITANYWGTINWATFGRSIKTRRLESTADHESVYPEYPNYYPKRLLYQDGDMRAVLEGIVDANPDPDDLLMMVLRCTTRVGSPGVELPGRLYVTCRRLYVYVSWQGIVSVESLPLERILQVENSPGVDFDVLTLTVHSEDGLTPTTVSLKLYVESGFLAQRRLDFMVENCRSMNPLGAQNVFQSIGLIGIEHANAFRKQIEETDMSYSPMWSSEKPLPVSADDSGINDSVQSHYTMKDESMWLRDLLSRFTHMPHSHLTNSNSNGVRGEEETLRAGADMDWKLGEDTYPFGPHILFIVMFGDKSPVFSGPVSDTQIRPTNVGPWYWNNRKLERQVFRKWTEASGAPVPGLNMDILRPNDSSVTRTCYQVVELIEENHVYSVTERRPAWEFPKGQVFNMTYKYLIYDTEHGTHMQIWGGAQFNRKGSLRTFVANHLMRDLAKTEGRNVLQRVRDAAIQLQPQPTMSIAISKFGKIRAAAVNRPVRPSRHGGGTSVASISAPTGTKRDPKIVPLSCVSVIMYILMKPLQFLFNMFHFLAVDFRVYLGTLPALRCFILLVMASSLVLNVMLLARSSLTFWTGYWLNRSAQQRVDALGLMSPHDMVAKRTVYTQDLTDAVASGSLFNVSHELKSDHHCIDRFRQLTIIAADRSDEPYWEFEPSASATMQTIESIRRAAALRRNRLMVELRLVNVFERESLLKEYHDWLVREVAMCAKVRPKLYLLNTTVFDSLRNYCTSCVEAAAAEFL